MANKGLVALGAGAIGLGALLFFRKKAEAAPQVPADNVGVMLRNPPSEATMWSLRLTDWEITVPIKWVNTEDRLTFEDQAVFEIPDGITFPLRVLALQITRWKDGIVGGTLQVLYEVQSVRPIKPFTTDDPDPDYREIFIPDFGSYYYNVSKERFE